ncbi:CPBP family intramembrane glutamic endopeptidase [[Eubacterium] cellulosolvens]
MKESKGFYMERILYSILVPPLAIAPVGVLLFLLGVDVSIIRDTWYLSIFVSCVVIALRDKTPLSQIGLSKHKLGSSLLLASAWELVTFLILGLIPFYAITRRLPTPAPFNQTMITPMLHFLLVGLSEETWIRGLLLKRLREWRPEGSAAALWSSVIFVLFHVPAATLTIIGDRSLLPLLALSWSTLFVWAAGLAYITIKTGNLLGPIVVHGVDDIITKVLYPLQA